MVKAENGGMALPVILLLLLALTVLGHGTLLLSKQELKTSVAFRHALRAGQAAEAAVRLGREVQDFPLADRGTWRPHALVSGETGDGLRYQGILRWLNGEFFLLEGSGGSLGWEGKRRTGLVGWSLLPEVRLEAFRAGAEVGGRLTLEEGGQFEMGSFLEAPGEWREAWCAPYRVVLDSLFPGGAIDPVGSLPKPVLEDPAESIPPLGLLSGSQLLEIAGPTSLPQSGPSPGVSVLGCPEVGEPVFLGSSGSVEMSRDRICGLLVVEGDLRLGGDARFQGLALIGGDLILEGRANFEGMARVGGGIQLGGAGTFSGSACPVLRVLEGLPALQRPLFLEGTFLNGF